MEIGSGCGSHSPHQIAFPTAKPLGVSLPPRNITIKVGIGLNDITLCQKVKSETWKNDCISVISIQTGNSAGCNTISDPKIGAECLSSIGEKTNDSALCDMITVNEDTEFEISNKKDACYYSVATQKNNADLCNKISTNASLTKNDCLCQIALNTLSEETLKKIDSNSGGYYECKRKWPGEWPLT